VRSNHRPYPLAAVSGYFRPLGPPLCGPPTSTFASYIDLSKRRVSPEDVAKTEEVRAARCRHNGVYRGPALNQSALCCAPRICAEWNVFLLTVWTAADCDVWSMLRGMYAAIQQVQGGAQHHETRSRDHGRRSRAAVHAPNRAFLCLSSQRPWLHPC
jgi:hypothetical protein